MVLMHCLHASQGLRMTGEGEGVVEAAGGAWQVLSSSQSSKPFKQRQEVAVTSLLHSCPGEQSLSRTQVLLGRPDIKRQIEQQQQQHSHGDGAPDGERRPASSIGVTSSIWQ